MAKALVIKNADFSVNALTTTTFIDIHCTDITLSGDTVMLVGDTQRITPTLTPVDTTDIITWSSSNTNIATVIGGLVTCVGAGTVTITATCGSYSATLSIECVALDLIRAKTWAPTAGYITDSKRAIIIPSLVHIPYGATITYQLANTNYKINIQVCTTETYSVDTITFTTYQEGKDTFTRIYDMNRTDGLQYTYNIWSESGVTSTSKVYFTLVFTTNSDPTVTLTDSDITAIKTALTVNLNHQAI